MYTYTHIHVYMNSHRCLVLRYHFAEILRNIKYIRMSTKIFNIAKMVYKYNLGKVNEMT